MRARNGLEAATWDYLRKVVRRLVRLGLDHRQIAEALEMSPASVSRLRNGDGE